MGYWATIARPIVAKVLKETEGQDERTIRKALAEAYPFGERRMWPYKAWLGEIKRQRKQVKQRGMIVDERQQQMEFD